jgi:hypothetical protein
VIDSGLRVKDSCLVFGFNIIKKERRDMKNV